MRIASLFQRRRRLLRGSRRALYACASVAGLSGACFFELEPLVTPGVGGTGSADAGAIGGGGSVVIGGAGGDSDGGDGGDAVDGPVCTPGTKNCGGACVPIGVENGCGSAACTPCAPVPAATLSCNTDTGACQVVACDPGFADCDGDTAAYTGEAAGNGCEYSFGPAGEIREVPASLEVPQAAIDIADGGRDDWTGVAAYPLIATCDNCFDDALPDVTAKNEVPARRDLEAFFRIAWDENFLYVLGDVFDNALVSDGLALGDGRCQNGALCEDAFTIFADGRNDRAANTGYGIDDLRVFVALGGQAFRVSGAPVKPEEVDFKATVHGPACYRIEAQVAWSYIVAAQNGQEVPNSFPPRVGQEYGFDISINDWDPGVSDSTPRRESQLFWVSPGDQYQHQTSGFGSMRLIEGTPAGAAQ